MENTSCTTLTRDVLHDEKVLPDYTFDISVVVHELAHQWFGDLVTCKDWSNIWLNEAFASYSEALYWQESRKEDEFLYKVQQDMTRYLDEANRLYKRPIVTKIYKHADELFDAHSYRKGSCVLHMLRQHIGNTNFKNSLIEYLRVYQNSNAETDDFRKICEKISGKDLQQFFGQWLYREQHPVLDVEYSLNNNNQKDNKKMKIKITQVQNEDAFVFPLEMKIVFANDAKDKKPEGYQISGKVFEEEIDIPYGKSIDWISIDPNFKLLKEIKSIKILEEKDDFKLKEILVNQLKNSFTIVECIQALNLLKNYYSEDIISVLENKIVQGDFYGVSVEAANVLGSYYDKSNYVKTDNAYKALVRCLKNSNVLASQVRRAIIRNIGTFERPESLPLLLDQLKDQNYFIQAVAATAIGKSAKNIPAFSKEQKEQKETIIKKLKEIAAGPTTFQNVVASGAIDGLKEFYKDENTNTIIEIADFLIRKTTDKNEYYVRASATTALGKFLVTNNEEIGINKEISKKAQEMNKRVFDCLTKLLQDQRRRIKINACTALADIDSKMLTLDPRLVESIKALVDVAEHDLDGFVRRPAERCANIIREWIKELTSKPPKLGIKLRERREFLLPASYSESEKEDNERTLETIRMSIVEC
jgi:aminopeptidase N